MGAVMRLNRRNPATSRPSPRRSLGALALIAAIVTVAGAQEKAESQGVVIPAERMPELRREFRIGPVDAPFWTPTDADVQRAETALKRSLSASWNPTQRQIASQLDGYRRQYVGFTMNGRRAIYVNAFCEHHWKRDPGWKTQFVLVLDGGECFFQATYVVPTDRIIDISVNGRA